jgi:dTDP-4-amino-4,6-dideoxygalactose transaminase
MSIPLVDLRAQYRAIRAEIDQAIADVIGSTAFAGGPFVERFEGEFAAYCEARHAIGVGSGTEALWLVLMALGVGKGDEVITVPNSFFATAEAISMCGATPVFVDVEERTSTMNAAALESAIGPRTRAVIPVHLYGQTCDMDPINGIARRHGLFVLEDACQAHGARYKGRRAGVLGDAAAFSFYPGKNLGAYGEAGAVVTSDEALARRIRVLRDHGQTERYYHGAVGWNARMDGIQAAVLSAKLRYLEEWNGLRRSHARTYNRLLAGTAEVVTPVEAEGNTHVYHVYGVHVPERDVVRTRLAQVGVSCGVHYPLPIHLQEAYRGLGFENGSFPVAERLAERELSLPMYPELGEEQLHTVAEALAGVFAAEGVHSR